MSEQIEVHLQVRKYLLSMRVNEQRSLSVRMCAYTTLKSTAVQLKKLGQGVWKIGHSNGHDRTNTTITRLS